jgi:hypothetical protein
MGSWLTPTTAITDPPTIKRSLRKWVWRGWNAPTPDLSVSLCRLSFTSSQFVFDSVLALARRGSACPTNGVKRYDQRRFGSVCRRSICRRSFYYGTRTAVPTLTPMPAGGLGEEISRVQTCCAPGPTYILKVGDMPGPGVRVPVQSAATV